MAHPLAYFLTWSTYGSWLPGDERGWVDRKRRGGEVVSAGSPQLERHAEGLLRYPAVILDDDMRRAAEGGLKRTCGKHGWLVHALSVRSNHVHIVLSAPEAPPGKTMGVLKRAATEALSEGLRTVGGGPWWTKQGSKRVLWTERAVAAAVEYVRNQ